MPDLPDAFRTGTSLDRRQFLIRVGATGTFVLGTDAFPLVVQVPRYLANEMGELLADESGNRLIGS